MKRGQLTAFIIVGIVILFVLAFTIYFLSIISDRPMTPGTAPEQTDARTCLEQASAAVIESIAIAGGSADAASQATLSTGEQVWIGVRSTNEVVMAPLCLRRGSNAPNASRDSTNSCMAGTYQLFQPDEHVIQYALQASIADAVANCGIAGPVTVILGDDDVSVITANVTARVPARLKRVYNAAFLLAVQDSRDPAFDKRGVTSIGGCPEGSFGNECLLPGLLARVTSDGSVDIVSITDSLRKVRGQPLTFRFLIDNRQPTVDSALQGTYQVTAGETRQVALANTDSDEDSLTAACTASQVIDWIACADTGITISPPAGTAPRTVQVTYSLTDMHGSSASRDFSVTVS